MAGTEGPSNIAKRCIRVCSWLCSYTLGLERFFRIEVLYLQQGRYGNATLVGPFVGTLGALPNQVAQFAIAASCRDKSCKFLFALESKSSREGLPLKATPSASHLSKQSLWHSLVHDGLIWSTHIAPRE